MDDFGDELGGRIMGSAEGVSQRLLTGAFRKVPRTVFDALIEATAPTLSRTDSRAAQEDTMGGTTDAGTTHPMVPSDIPTEEESSEPGRRRGARRPVHRKDPAADDLDWVVAMSYADRAAADEAVGALRRQGVDAVVSAQGPDGTCDVVAQVSPRAAAGLGASIAKADAKAHKGEFEADMARVRGASQASAVQAHEAGEQEGPVLKARGA